MGIERKNWSQPIKCQCCPHIETSQLICTANQLTGFYMRETLPFNGLILTSYFGKVRAIKLGQTQSVDLSCSHNTNIIQFVSNDQQYQHLT